ncbi:class II glutamine amidotransferase domain-containing protein [Microbacterium wangchenii]|uniref:hypothetical protein n=1 Tax=Microbacterium wangchenii TaxID=2541726 RepID=UPI0011C9CCEC|nr:hypothetical protein [Microbacterium wangchenii]TXK15781.1 hypothetical protein FVP99_09770 [Microbacterium wangchenii]
MCGIAGEIDFRQGSVPRDRALRAVAALGARGPDGDGVWDGGWAVLGHRRLSAVDLSERGAQPMVDEMTGTAIVFNGCVYNHDELRRELSADGRFHSLSDTEVILMGYRVWGERVLRSRPATLVDPLVVEASGVRGGVHHENWTRLLAFSLTEGPLSAKTPRAWEVAAHGHGVAARLPFVPAASKAVGKAEESPGLVRSSPERSSAAQ